jgi:hypothetical protein
MARLKPCPFETAPFETVPFETVPFETVPFEVRSHLRLSALKSSSA